MELSTETIHKICERFEWDWCNEYGERGYGDARAMVLSRARVLLREMERKAAEVAMAEFPPTTSDMAYIEDGVVYDVETWNN